MLQIVESQHPLSVGEIYERVEEKKRKEMVELEKQRMRFSKELECHRIQLFTEMQVATEEEAVDPAVLPFKVTAAAMAPLADLVVDTEEDVEDVTDLAVDTEEEAVVEEGTKEVETVKEVATEEEAATAVASLDISMSSKLVIWVGRFNRIRLRKSRSRLDLRVTDDGLHRSMKTASLSLNRRS
ncbi:unnamed protein product [Cochlearia groenlandica]